VQESRIHRFVPDVFIMCHVLLFKQLRSVISSLYGLGGETGVKETTGETEA